MRRLPKRIRSQRQPYAGTLAGPLPQFIGERDDGALQTPFDLRKWLIIGMNKAGDGQSGLSYPVFVRRAKTDCLRMLMRSLVFSNEFVHLIDFQKLRTVKTRAELDTHGPFEFLAVETSTMTVQQIEDLFAPVRVSNVLLAEPLRFYYQAVTEVPALRDRRIPDLNLNHSRLLWVFLGSTVPRSVRWFTIRLMNSIWLTERDLPFSKIPMVSFAAVGNWYPLPFMTIESALNVVLFQQMARPAED